MTARSLLTGAGVVAIALVGVGLLDQSGPDAQSHPELAVTLDNARSAVHTGDLITYTTRVRNLGQSDRELVVTQLLPAALQVLSTEPVGRSDPTQIAWTVDVAAGGIRTLTTEGRVTESRHGYSRLSTSSCVGVAEHPTLSCSSDSDRLRMPPAADRGPDVFVAGGMVLGLLTGGLAGVRAGRDGMALSNRALGPAWVGMSGRMRLPRWAVALVRPAASLLSGLELVGSAPARPARIVTLPRRLGNARDPPAARTTCKQAVSSRWSCTDCGYDMWQGVSGPSMVGA